MKKFLYFYIWFLKSRATMFRLIFFFCTKILYESVLEKNKKSNKQTNKSKQTKNLDSLNEVDDGNISF